MMLSKKLNRTTNTKGVALIVVSSFFYGTYGIWSRLMGDSFGAFSQGAIRAILVVLILLPMVLYSGGLKRFSIKNNKKWLLVSLGSSFFTAAPIYYAMNTIGIGLSLVLFYAFYFLSMQAFDFLTKRRLPISREIATIIMALLGILIIYRPNGDFVISLGSVAAMLAGVGTGFNVLASEKISTDSVTTTLIAWLCGAIVMLPMALIIHDQIPSLSSVAWLYLVLFSCCSVISSGTVITAVKIVSTGLVGLIGLLEIVFGIIFGRLFFNETISIAMIIGSMLIITAAAIPNMYELKQQRKVKV